MDNQTTSCVATESVQPLAYSWTPTNLDNIHMLASVLTTPGVTVAIKEYANKQLLKFLKAEFGDELSVLPQDLQDAAREFRQFTGECQPGCECGQCQTRY